MPPLPQQTSLPIPQNTAGSAAMPQAPAPKPAPQPQAAPAPQAPADPLRGILDPDPSDRAIKRQAWDAYQSANTPEAFRKSFDSLGISQESKRALWNLKFQGAQQPQPQQPPGPVQQLSRYQQQLEAEPQGWGQYLPQGVLSPGMQSLNKLVQAPVKSGQWLREKAGQAGQMAAEAMPQTGFGGMGIHPTPPTAVGAIRGGMGALGEMVGNPTNWPFFAGGMAKPLLQKLISGGFGVQMGMGVIEGAKDLYQNWDAYSPMERAEKITSSGIDALFAGTAAREVGARHGGPGVSPAQEAAPRTVEDAQAATATHARQADELQQASQALRDLRAGTVAARTQPSETPAPTVRQTPQEASTTQVGATQKSTPPAVQVAPKQELKAGYESAPAPRGAVGTSTAGEQGLRETRSGTTPRPGMPESAALGQETTAGRGERKVTAPQPPSEATRLGMDKAATERAQAAIEQRRQQLASQQPPTMAPERTQKPQEPLKLAPRPETPKVKRPDMSREEQLELHQQYPELFAHPDQPSGGIGGHRAEPAEATAASIAARQPVPGAKEPSVEPGKPLERQPLRGAEQPAAGAEPAKPPEVERRVVEGRPPEGIPERRKFLQDTSAALRKTPRAMQPGETPEAFAKRQVDEMKGLGEKPGQTPVFESVRQDLERRKAEDKFEILPEKPTQKEVSLDRLKEIIKQTGGNPKVVENIIAASDKVGGPASERYRRAHEALTKYSQALAREKNQGQKGFFSFRGKPSQKSAKRVAQDSLEKLTAGIEKLPKGKLDARIEAAQKLAASGTKGSSPLTQNFMKLVAASKATVDWYKHGPEKGQTLGQAVTGKQPSVAFKAALGEYQNAKMRHVAHLKEFVDEVQKTFPHEEIREAITNYIQAGGDDGVLADRASKSTDRKLKAGYELARQLNATEKAAAEVIKHHFEDRLKEGQALGILDHGIENYVTQIWKKDAPAAISGFLSELNAGKFDKNFKYARQRFYESFFEGEQAGKTPATKDIGKLITAYERNFHEAVLARKFARDLWNGNAADKRPLLVPETKYAKLLGENDLTADQQAYAIPLHGGPSGRLMDATLAQLLGIPVNEKTLTANDKIRTDTSGYQRIDHPAFRKHVWSMTGADGKPIYVQGDAWAHPDIAEHLTNLYKQSWFRQNRLMRAALEVQSGMKQTLLGVPTFHYVQEDIHGIGHKINPLSKDIMSGRAVKDLIDDPVVERGMKNGLQLYSHDDHGWSEGIKGLTGAVGKLLKVTPGVKSLPGMKRTAAFLEGMQDHLFKEFIPSLKATMYKDAYARNVKRYSDELSSGKLTPDKLAEITAYQANAAFGELNYDWMGRSKNAQDALRLIALAPDFLEARARFLGQSLRPYGGEQRAALFLRLGLYQWMAARTLNMVLNQGQSFIDDPDMAFKIKVGDRVYGFRTMASDIEHFVRGPFDFMVYRTAPYLRIAIQAGAHLFKGKKLTFSDAIKMQAPIPVQGAIQDAISKTVKDKKYADSLYEGFGIYSEKYRTPEEKAAIAAKEEKRQKALHGEKTPKSLIRVPGAPRLR